MGTSVSLLHPLTMLSGITSSSQALVQAQLLEEPKLRHLEA